MKTLSRMMLAAAVTSMAVLPVAAEAGTRASSSKSVVTVSAPGKGRAAKGEKQGEGGIDATVAVVGGLALVAVVGGIVAAGNDGKPSGCKTPSAC